MDREESGRQIILEWREGKRDAFYKTLMCQTVTKKKNQIP
jgi:hypothetical protein